MGTALNVAAAIIWTVVALVHAYVIGFNRAYNAAIGLAPTGWARYKNHVWLIISLMLVSSHVLSIVY